jgi:hypothetical protein
MMSEEKMAVLDEKKCDQEVAVHNCPLENVFVMRPWVSKACASILSH